MSDDYRIAPAGDSALILEFEERIDTALNDRAVRLAGTIEAAAIPGVRDVLPTYRSVAVYFDPLRTDGEALSARLVVEAGRSADEPSKEHRLLRIPVCYGGVCGPDLGEVAAGTRMSEGEVIALHSAVTYRVFMMGFLPGFAYLGTVDKRIAVPRRSSPRVRVPAGSVGIAGQQTGIYPVESPGGWQVVGRTPIRAFDLSQPEPFLLKAGDDVQFYPIETAQYLHKVDGSKGRDS